MLRKYWVLFGEWLFNFQAEKNRLNIELAERGNDLSRLREVIKGKDDVIADLERKSTTLDHRLTIANMRLGECNTTIDHWRGLYESEHSHRQQIETSYTESLRMLADYMAEQRFGHQIFGTLKDPLPENPMTPDPIPATGIQGRKKAERITRETLNRLKT